jgi:hypothetical protein
LDDFLDHFGMPDYQPRIKVQFRIIGCYEVDSHNEDEVRDAATEQMYVDLHSIDGLVHDSDEYTITVTALTQHRRHGADLSGALTGWQRRHLPTAVATVRQGPIIGARLGLGATTTPRTVAGVDVAVTELVWDDDGPLLRGPSPR